MMAHCSVCAGQRSKTDDIFLHPRHALCPPQPRPLRGHRGEAQHAQQADQDCEAVKEVRNTNPTNQPTLNFIISRLNAGTGNDESVFGKDAMEELVNTGDISYNHLSSGTVINHLDFVYETLLSPRNYLDIFLYPLPFTWKSQTYQLSGLF